MKIMLFVVSLVFASTGYSSELSSLQKELSSLSKKNINISFEVPQRGLSGIFHSEDNFGNCQLSDGNLVIQLNKIWYYDINPENKAKIIWDSCKKLLY